VSWLTDIIRGTSVPQIGRGGGAYTIGTVVDANGELFSLESCKKEYAYDGGDNLTSIKATEPGTNKVRVKTYTLSATNKPATESGWVPQ